MSSILDRVAKNQRHRDGRCRGLEARSVDWGSGAVVERPISDTKCGFQLPLERRCASPRCMAVFASSVKAGVACGDWLQRVST